VGPADVNPVRTSIAALVLGAAVFLPAPAVAQSSAAGCDDGRRLAHTFDSGAAWSLCARIDEHHGLELIDLAYRAPGDRERPVLRSLHLAQILVHWHDANAPERRLGGNESGTAGLGGNASVVLGRNSCEGETASLAAPGADEGPAGVDTAADIMDQGIADEMPRLCARERASGLLAKYDQRAALQGEDWELFAVARQGLLVWRTGVTLTEDGSIAPSLALSGRLTRTSEDPRYAASATATEAGLVGAVLHATWRLAFALDTPATDRVEEFDFALETGAGNRRTMRIRPLVDESLRQVRRDSFRGWRVVDGESGAGYFLDPLDSALAWNSPGDDWARFDLAITRTADCERLASGNEVRADAGCGAGLDDFVNGEALDGADPVLWHSRTRNWVPRQEDLPFLSSVELDMRIIPFDWTDASPFEVVE